jgi:TRAP-type mannitol/chloroaromatic compound transport system permease small subunit
LIYMYAYESSNYRGIYFSLLYCDHEMARVKTIDIILILFFFLPFRGHNRVN